MKIFIYVIAILVNLHDNFRRLPFHFLGNWLIDIHDTLQLDASKYHRFEPISWQKVVRAIPVFAIPKPVVDVSIEKEFTRFYHDTGMFFRVEDIYNL